jgi:tRNA-modifying protein YgfZ
MAADDNRRMTTSFALEGCVALSHWGVIRARGADAASFLHSQLTSDIDHLRPDAARLAGYCSPKGRLLASFVVWKRSDDEILLACSADLLAATLKRLSMFVLRAKCKLSDASAEIALFGLAGPSALAFAAGQAPASAWERASHEGGDLVRLPDVNGAPRFLWAAPAGTPAPALPPLGIDAWRWGEVASGVVLIEAATVDQFVPQMVNYELLGGVDFQKGCYPGQEIVARSQYRGTLKRRSFLFSSAGTAARAGQEVFHSEDPAQPAGLVANAASTPHAGGLALVELKLSALRGGSLHLGAVDGPVLQRADLPYVLPADTA